MIERLHLEIIDALNREGSLTKAADALNLTQPALTHSIKKLENNLCCKIWIKEGRAIKLTVYGEFLLKRAQKILPQYRELEETLSGMVAGKKGLLKICVECSPCYEIIVGVIKEFLVKWKDVDIDVSKNFQFNGIGAILNRSVDLIISPDPYKHPALEYYPIIDFEIQLAVADGHSLIDKSYVEPKDLVDQTIITYPVEVDRLDIFTSFLIPAGVRPKKHQTVEATEVMLQLVSAGRGISYFPKWLIERYRSVYNINGVPLGANGIEKTLYICIRKEDREVKYIKDFIKMMNLTEP